MPKTKPSSPKKPAKDPVQTRSVQPQTSTVPNRVDDKERQHQLEHLAQLIEKFEIAMLTTEQPDGSLRSRPMIAQKDRFDGTLWFLSENRTPKIGEIQGHTQVNVTYANPGNNTYISISGRASLVNDRAAIVSHWHKGHEPFFAGGPDDPNLVLLKIEVEQAEYWDDHKLMILLGAAKAKLRGEEFHLEAEHAKLSLAGSR
ncbi:MAG: pyridoxamine 5'-phosphate oxidase family protein [Candidatus Sericytochromatia bacterium]